MNNAPTLPTSLDSLPPEGALRLRPGEASPAAPAGGEGMPPSTLTSCGQELQSGLLPFLLSKGGGKGLPDPAIVQSKPVFIPAFHCHMCTSL